MYLASPDYEGPVTGSKLPSFQSGGTTYNHNIFRIEGPNGYVASTYNFSVMGRIFSGTVQGDVKIDRANYATKSADKQLTVYGTGHPTVQGRIPPNPAPPALPPVLAFYSAPCGVDPVSGGLAAPQGVASSQMFTRGSSYWGKGAPAAIPTHVCVEDQSLSVPTFHQAPVTDQITITEALFDPNGAGTLTVKAASSDEVNAPVLTLAGEFNQDLVSGQTIVTPLAAPPSKVVVVSSVGGLADTEVTTVFGGGGAPPPVVPVAVNDEFSTPEDAPVNMNVLANDTYGGAPIVCCQNVTVINMGGPFSGTATFNANGTITYTPSLDFSGVDGIAYAVRVNGVQSPTAHITINVTAVNDGVPIAVNDSATAAVNVPRSIDVLANDIDPDGHADLVSAVELTVGTLPAGVATPPTLSASGGIVTFTAFAPGTYTFTYKAQDSTNLRSSAATATVTVSGTETITVLRSEFIASSLRWRVEGSDTLPAGQVLELSYMDGSYRTAAGTSVSARNLVFATVVVGGDGNWALDMTVGGTGVTNPTNTAGNANGFWVSVPRFLRVKSRLTIAAASAAIVRP
jgi:hypothetical protein